MDGFRETIEDFGLLEIVLSGENATLEKGKGTTNWVHERLDRASATVSCG